MYLPTPQFARLVTILAFDLTNPALDSMILAWDHIATRHLARIAANQAVAGKVESIRLPQTDGRYWETGKACGRLE